MCLKVYNKGIKSLSCSRKMFETEEDITCYKVVKKFNHSDGSARYVSPFQEEKEWKEGETYEDKYDVSTWFNCDCTRLNIGKGMFHTNKTLYGAKYLKKLLMKEWGTKDITIAKCIIPKGTSMYKGWFDEYDNEYDISIRGYASKSLKIVKFIE